jgi:hypothetical protein
MEIFLSIIKIIAVLIATIIIGNWFLSEIRQAKRNGASTMRAYLSLPGLLILFILSLPVILWLFK